MILVKVRSGEKKQLLYNWPLPLTLASWIIAIAERFVDQEMAGHLRASAGLLRIVRHDRTKGEPIAVEVDQGEERVQIYID